MRPSDDMYGVRIIPGIAAGGSDSLREAFEIALPASRGIYPKGSQEAANKVGAVLRERYPHLRILVEADSDGDLVWTVDEFADRP